MLKNKVCLGCGAIKQTTNINDSGYVKDLNHDYCLECFQLKNYGKSNGHIHPTHYDEIKPNSLILVIQSIMQLDLLFSLPIARIQPNAKYLYVINQIDLLPPETNLDKLYDNVYRLARKNHVKLADIIFMSAINQTDIDNLKDYLLSFKNKDIYLFGFQNSGKTTILKGLTKNTTALNINKAGLTQNIITDAFEDKIIHDMPGTYVKGYLADYFDYEEYKKLLPSSTIYPKVYTITNKQKLVINEFVEIKILGKEKSTLIFYFNQFNKFKRINLENKSNYLLDKFTYQTKSYKVSKKSTLNIADLGFVVINDNVNIEIKYPKNMHISIMESII